MSRKPSTPDSDLESHAAGPHPLLRTLRLADGARTALTAVGFLAGLSVLGVSADALAAYRDTHLPAEFHLPLWPENFNAGPTIALVVCSVIIVVANGASLALCRGKDAHAKASYPLLTLLAPPLASLIAALVAISFFYAVNASDTTDTLLSWSCRWRSVAMESRPDFGALCRQSRAGVHLSTVLVPLQVLVVGVATWQAGVARGVRGGLGVGSRKGSAPSSRGM